MIYSRRKSRLLSLILIASFIISLFPVNAEVAEGAAMTVQQCIEKYNYLSPPPEFPICNKGAKVWNKKLYDDLGIIAYGDVLQANTEGDFKKGWQDKYGEVRTDTVAPHPYFSQNGVKGEYRYYGWDKNNTLYSNMYFINDSPKGTDPNTRDWIYRPWDATSLIAGRADKPTRFSPMLLGKYNSPLEIYQSGDPAVRDVNKVIKVDGLQVRNTAKNQDKNKEDKNLFDYMYVEQDPTVWADGQGRMWHLKKNGDIWYQSFGIDQLNSKEKTDVVAEIIPTNITTTDLNDLGSNWVWNLNLKGTLQDSKYFNDRYLKTQHYTRSDVSEWTLKLEYSYKGQKLIPVKTFTSQVSGDVSFQNQGMIALSNIDVPLEKGVLKKDDIIDFVLTVTTKFKSNPQLSSQDTYHYPVTLGEKPPPDIPDPKITEYPPGIGGPPPVACVANIPNDAFDIVEYGAMDNTDLSRIANRQVWVDGVEVDADLFYNGGYVFGDDKDGLVTVSMRWTPIPGEDKNGANGCDTYRIVLVHDTKPRAQFKLFGDTFKENRKMSVDNTSRDPNANDPFVQATYPIVSSSWSWSATDGSSDSERRMGEDGDDHKEFLYKKPGEYVLTLTVTNALGRTSDPYVLPFSVLPDFNPAVVFYPYSSQIGRGEGVSMLLDAVSTDKDTVTNTNFKVYYDVNNDETYSQLIDTFSTPLSEYKPLSNKLGKYRIVVIVDEEFGQETLPEYITAADKRSTTQQFEFEIDNYVPYSDIYTDIPTVRQTVDTFFLLDKNLTQSKIDYVKGNAVTINNQLRLKGADPTVNAWDMHTYTFSQPAATTVNTGGYPSTTYSHSAGGYSGTLNLQSVSDNGSYYDFGSNQTVVDVPGHNESYQEPWCYAVIRGIEYSHGGHCDSEGNETTITRERWVNTTFKTVWVPNIQWVSNWYGTYSGTMFKDVRQPLVNPFVRATSNKFVIYISDDTINELGDFNKVKGLTDARIILVGKPGIKTQTGYDHFIENTGQPIEDIIQSAVDYISTLNPPTASQTVMVGETFQMLTDETDPESDPIVQRQTMYIHDENHFDNPMGHAAFAANEYNPVKWGNETLRNSFAMTGEYRILRRIKDQPSPDPKFASYSYYSNESETIVLVHRKPIAQADLDWTYDSNSSTYLTSWVDLSYDLDHNISDPVKKGIVDRKIKFTFGGETYFKIPDQLAAGTYHLEYLVKDVEGAWSDPFIMDFTLAATPPPQLKSKLKAQDSAFSLTLGIPASEKLTAYDLWTRYPYSLSLSLQMPPGGGMINKTIPYFTGTKTGSDITWADVIGMLIPDTTPDGTYNFRIQANGSVGGTYAYNDHSVNVFTPINLIPTAPASNALVVVGYPVTLTGTTTKYPSSATATLFYGTSYAQTVSLSATGGAGGKTWNFNMAAVPNIPDGNYTIRYTATNPSGKSESVNVPIRVTHNTPPTGSFKTYTYDSNNTLMPKFEGDTVHIDPVGINDNEHDTLSVNYTVKDPDGAVVLNKNYSWSYPYPTTGGPTLVANKVGTYTVTQTLNDGKAAPVVLNGTFQVAPLGITGMVSHTPQWESNRMTYNNENPGNPRTADTFWAGEEFILSSGVTNTSTSWDKAQRVTVSLTGQGITVDLVNTPSGGLNWSGSMWRDNFDDLPDGNYSFLFTVNYSNGIVKTTVVAVKIKDSIWEVTKTHRTH
ncbi:Athe_2463 domain-containing protein [Paenibacillus sp. sgz500958]|uniref:Athe_2463 domain-containing protein n=1 Tax=Paenibacillus sp. sgz500958 TaxID=3242475 RepID=UPI0036D2FB79